MSIITIQTKTEQEWLDLRLVDITSTKVSALFGLSPYITKFELWNRMKYNKVAEFESNERMKWGTVLEHTIAETVAKEQGWEARPMKEYMRDTELRAGSSFDWSIEGDNPGILEVKNVDGLVYRNNWTETEAPLHIEMQVQHQLMVSGRSYAYIAVLVGGNELHLIERKRDEVVISRMREEIMKFWKSIDDNEPPEPDFQADAQFIAEVYGYAEPGKLFDARGNTRLDELMAEYKEANAQEKLIKGVKASCKSEILTIIEDAEKVTGDGYSISAGIIGECKLDYTRKSYRNFKPYFKKVK